MQYRITLVSPWTKVPDFIDSTKLVATPQFGQDHTYISWSESSVRDPREYMADPNLGTLEAVVDDVSLAAIEADSTYYIISCEEVPDALP